MTVTPLTSLTPIYDPGLPASLLARFGGSAALPSHLLPDAVTRSEARSQAGSQDRLGTPARGPRAPRRVELTLCARGLDGSPVHPGDLAAQVAHVIRRIETALEGAGLALTDVVSYTVRTTDLAWYHRDGHPQVARQFVAVNGMRAGGRLRAVETLTDPENLVELTVLAVR